MLADVVDWTGKTLVSVTTGTSDDAVEMEQWASDRGARYLDGAPLCLPHQLGTAQGIALYSGATETWAIHEPILMTPGPSSALVSPGIEGASVFDRAIIGGFLL